MTKFFADNVSWIIPLSVTFLFSALNIFMALLNYKNAKETKKLQRENMRYQLLDDRTKLYNTVQEIYIRYRSTGSLNGEYADTLNDIKLKFLYIYGKDVYSAVCALEQSYVFLLETHFLMREYQDNNQQELYIKAKQEYRQYEDDFIKNMRVFEASVVKYLDFSEYTKEVKK